MKKSLVILYLLLQLITVLAQYPTPLPSSGTINMQQIYNWMLAAGEVSTGPNSISNLNSHSHLADKTAPYSLSDWYGYSPPAFSCGNGLTVTHTAGTVAAVTKTVTYGTVTSSLSGASKCWITQNLGATQQATSVTDATEASAGWYWEFNLTQGYKLADDGTTRTPSSWNASGDPGGGNWELAKDPCRLLLGSTWRLPTNTEYTNAIGSGGWYSGVAIAYGSVLKLHASGYLLGTGALSLRGGSTGVGYYWSSVGNSYGYSMMLRPSTGDVSGNFKNFGFSVRCLKD